MLAPSALSALLLSLSPSLTLASSQPKDAILLSSVRALTLRHNTPTTSRRLHAIPQLKCISSAQICALHKIDIMRCTNQGSSYGSEAIEWSCAADLPPELRLGSTDVLCEGYQSSEDEYVLRGSCGVEYRLVLTEAGERRFPEVAGAGSSGGWFSGWGKSKEEEPLRYNSKDKKEEGSTLGAYLFGIIFVGVVFWILYSAWTQATATTGPDTPRRRRPRNTWFGGGGGGFDPGYGPGGGGGGGGYSYDPPPPYSKYSSTSSSSSRQNQEEGWRPGFWSGVAGGAAAAYMAGNRGSGSRQQESRNSFFGGGGGNSGSGGGGGGGGWGSTPSSSSSSGGGGSVSSTRYTSTGFGSTRRR
ncbi:hypothetical protein F4777DRAFT_556697 [Nemania sp. FL0916]|nr:hypothetical protein F4777DRAFT_556697 [Nemania sp. FL0916]